MASQKHFIVYRTVNKLDGKFYIGQHITEDLEDGYLGSGYRIASALKKHGIENFEREILFDFSTFEEMNQKEKELVTESLLKNPLCYNIALGGAGSWWHVHQKWNDKFYREKISQNFRELARLRHSEGKLKPVDWTGKSHREETKRKIGTANSVHMTGEGNSNFGKIWIHSEEEKKTKPVKKTELQLFLDLGWKVGRKQKYIL